MTPLRAAAALAVAVVWVVIVILTGVWFALRAAVRAVL